MTDELNEENAPVEEPTPADGTEATGTDQEGPAAASGEAAPGKRRRLTKGRVVLLSVLVVLLVAGLVFWGLGRPIPLEDHPVAVEENTRLNDMLQGVGLRDVVVDVTTERALVRYNVPSAIGENATEWYLWYTIGAAHAVAPDSGHIVVQIYRDFDPYQEVVVLMADVDALMNGHLDHAGLEERMTRRDLGG